MITAPFDYYTPTSVQEAISLLQQHGDTAKLLAGGHSLIPLMKLRLANPGVLIDISRIPGLAFIREEGDRIVIGALTTHAMIEQSALLKERLPLLPETAARIGDLQVRNRGTIGGSLAHADPAADLPAALLALDAELVCQGPHGERILPAREFFVGMLTTALQPDEVLTAVRFPVPSGRTGMAYRKIDHPASHYAVVGIAALVTMSNEGTVARAAIGITGAATTPSRAAAPESALQGQRPTPEGLARAAEQAADGLDLLDDLYASAEYRRHLVRVETRRALETAAQRAQERQG